MKIPIVAKWLTAVVAGIAALAALVKGGAIAVDLYTEGPDAHAEVDAHHDSLEAAYTVIEDVQRHLDHDDSSRAEQTRQLDYLICLRIERKRQLEGRPPLKDCDAELLAGEGR